MHLGAILWFHPCILDFLGATLELTISSSGGSRAYRSDFWSHSCIKCDFLGATLELTISSSGGS